MLYLLVRRLRLYLRRPHLPRLHLPLLVVLIVGAVGIVIADGLVYRDLMLHWPWPWALPVTSNGQYDLAGLFVEELALGAVVTGFGTLVLGAFVGIIAIYEFAKSQERPKLVLSLRSNYSDEPLRDPSEMLTPWAEKVAPGQNDTQTLRLRADRFIAEFDVELVNRGPVVVIWYMVEIEGIHLTDGILAPQMSFVAEHHPDMPPGGLINLILGDDDNWNLTKDDSQWRIRFSSAGNLALYPGVPLPLCRCYFPTGSGSWGYEMTYMVVTDRTPTRNGILAVRTGPVPSDGKYRMTSRFIGS